MVVRFVVDSDLPDDISTMTLSYTFFKALSDDVVRSTIHTVTIEESG